MDDDLDRLGRRAGAMLLDDVTRRVDVDAALAAALDDGEPDATVRPIKRGPGRASSVRRPTRPRWPLLTAAAAAVLVVAGLGVLARHERRNQTAGDSAIAPPSGPGSLAPDLSVFDLSRLLPPIPADAVGLSVDVGDATVSVVDASDPAGRGSASDALCVRIDRGATGGGACSADGSAGLVAARIGDSPNYLAVVVSDAVTVSALGCDLVTASAGTHARLVACRPDGVTDVDMRFDAPTGSYHTTFSYASSQTDVSTPTTGPTSTMATTTTEQPADANLSIPALGGPTIDPTHLGEIAFGRSAGQLVAQNGEFPTPIVVLPDQLLILEETPFDGPTGRVLVLDRNGNWQFDTTIADLVGRDIAWLQGTPSGVFFVGTWADGDPDYRLSAYRLRGNELVEIDTVQTPRSDAPRGVLTPTGVDYPLAGDRVLTVDTGVPPAAVSVTFTRPAKPASPAELVIERTDQRRQTWTLDLAIDFDAPPDGATSRAETFGDGAWYADTTSFAPGSVGDFIALLRPDGTGSWQRLGGWSFAGYDADQLVFTRVLTTGLELATITSD